MGLISQVRVWGDAFCFGNQGRVWLDQWGKRCRASWSEEWEKALIDEWEPWITQAVDYVKRKSGKRRHGATLSVERSNFLCAVLMVAGAMKRGDGPEVVTTALYLGARW